MCVSDLIRPGFFILRTYVLWDKNKIVLAAMLSTFVVSSKLLTRPKLVVDASARYLSQRPAAFPSPLPSPQHVLALTLPLVFYAY
jgi:hypothetical protein